MVSADARIRQGRFCRFVRPGRRQLRLGRPRRMETGSSGKSGATFSNPTCTRRRDSGRYIEAAHSGSRPGLWIVELRSKIGRRLRKVDGRAATGRGSKGSREIEIGGEGPLTAAI